MNKFRNCPPPIDSLKMDCLKKSESQTFLNLDKLLFRDNINEIFFFYFGSIHIKRGVF